MAGVEGRTQSGVRLRVLLSAYACSPGWGSEPTTGWNAAREVAEEHDVWVLTSGLHRHLIEAELRQRPVPSLHFVYFDWPRGPGFDDRTRLEQELQYYTWQIAAYARARALHQRIRFDVAHHVTLGRYWMPSFLPFLPIPFVWGPVGGGESAPRQFWRGLGVKGAIFEAVRECARFVGEHDPCLRLSARRVALALATTPDTHRRMEKLGARRTEVLTNITLTTEELAELGCCEMPPPDPIRFISIGRLLPWKGFHLGLRAFARMREARAEYWIVGDGPARRTLEALARELNVADRVRFFGLVARPQVRPVLERCHALVHPSLHDSSGNVLIEAMGAGRPVVCLDLGGPGLLVTPDSGMKVPASQPEEAISGLAQAMDRLSASPELLMGMGRAARARANSEFDARTRCRQFSAFYAAIARTSPSPLSQTASYAAPATGAVAGDGLSHPRDARLNG